MDRLNMSYYSSEDETAVSITGEYITWRQAQTAFFRMLRGAGFVINPQDYVEFVTENLTELFEAEAKRMQSLDAKPLGD